MTDKTLERTVRKVARELDTLAEGWRTDDYADIFEWLYDQLDVCYLVGCLLDGRLSARWSVASQRATRDTTRRSRKANRR